MSRKKIATAPVAKARLPVSDASARPIADSTTANISATRRPGISALVSAHTAEPPCTLAIEPAYSRSSGTSSITSKAAVKPRYLASG